MRSKLIIALCALALLPVALLRADVLNLDGNGDYVTFPATDIPSGSASFTIECWINPTTIPTGGANGGQMTFWGNEAGNQANGMRLRGANGLRHFFWSNDHDENLTEDILPDTTGLTANGWHHFAIVWNGTQTRWYWNGVAIGSPRNSVGVNVVAANHRIGARPGGEFFHGYMDEVRVWNVARTAGEISANFQQELNGDEPGLVAYWNFEGNLTDKAGGNNNGTAVGNAVTSSGLNAPVAPVGPRVYSFTATPAQIFASQSATLAWAISNATSVVIDQGIGAVSPSNSVVVTPLVTTTYTLTATNATGTRVVTALVTVDPGVPSALNFSTNTTYNTPVAITLLGTDPQGSNLTYAIVAAPAHGSLSGTPPNVTYTPSNNFGGFDSFTFRVNDGSFDSAPATISVSVVPPPLAPTAILLSTTNIPSAAAPGSFIAALQAQDINNLFGDTHTFALVAGGVDNAKFTIAGNVLSAGPSFVGGPGATFSIRLRATDSTSLSYTQDVTLVVFDAPRSVVINEFHYNPSFNPVRESFIEIYNDTDTTVDLSNWRLRGGVDFSFPPNTFLAAHTFAVVAEDPATIQLRYGVTAFGPWDGGLNNDGEEFTLRDALNDVVDRVDFKSEFPWPIAANGNGPSAQLVNPALDNNLGSSWRSATPTPGVTNLAFSTNAAPHIRQVDHAPKSPRSTNQVIVTAKVTDPDGVASVTLAYQVVLPGSYIPATLPLTTAQLNNLNTTPMTNALNPAFELPANWTTVPMHDDGVNGDAVAGDGVFSVILPQQAHRTLVRYRITCTDVLGAARRAPFEDDPSLNFAYFVYDGVPNYQGFPAAQLETLPMFTLITRDADLAQCTAWFNGADQMTTQIINGALNEGRFKFNWEGAMVYDGEVYDHVRYRLRGANGRYHPGKRSIRYKFNDGRPLVAKDQYGKKFPTKWKELTTGKGQSNRGGEQFALNEVVNMFLWNKVGVPAPFTFHFHFRVIRGASEAGADQYSGDFWGLNWAQEKYDASFMDAHDLPKGNLYKLVDNLEPNIDERRYQGAFAVTNAADLFNVENNLTGFQNTDWLNAHANYTNWYRYFSIARAIRHYDTWPSANKNGAYYFEPRYGASNGFFGRMMQLPYDSTDTWGATWNNGDDLLYNGIFATTATGGDSGFNPAMQVEYRNVARELRNLLFQPDQMSAIIDAHAYPLYPVAAADWTRWRAAPAPASYNSLLIPSNPGTTGGLTNYHRDMTNFMFTGGNNAWWASDPSLGTGIPAGGWITVYDGLHTDAAIPTRPTIAYIGATNFPANGLTFQSSAFADPQGTNTFAAMQWRIAEVLPTNTAVSNLTVLKLEYDASWISPELPAFNSTMTFPEFAVAPGKTHRARVRHKDNSGRWSDWSLPAVFTPAPSPVDNVAALRANLVFHEIMYNPPMLGFIDGDELEYLELKNIGAFPLDLSGLSFTAGIEFVFTNGTTLAPGALLVLVRNSLTFNFLYPSSQIDGLYTGKLNNDGETLTISHPVAGAVVSITYGDRAPWPVSADGNGFSIVRDASGVYRASDTVNGHPGVDGGVSTVGGIVINELLSNSTLPLRDYIELINTASTNVDISGWFLTDDAKLPQKFRIPNRAPLAPGEFAVFTEDDFNPTPGAGTSFSLSSFGDELYLFSALTNSQLTGFDTGLSFGAAADGESFGRYLTSVGETHHPAQLARTPGAVNAAPRVGPVVLSEISYNPEAGGDEFVELKNLTGGAVALFDPLVPTNTWKLGGLNYTFPTNVTLGAHEWLLIVATNPAVFRAKYGVATNVQIVGPFTGNLQDSGERLALQQPGVPDTNGVPYIVIDEVRYNDKAPWPAAADGGGPALQRINLAAYGNDPTNWTAAALTPGTGFLGGFPPVITLQPTNRAVLLGGSVSFTVAASGDAPWQYRWQARGTNLPGATNATLTILSAQYVDATNYTALVFNDAGAAFSASASLTVFGPITFTFQPTNVFAVPFTNVILAAAAVGTGPVRYQWRFEGTNIPNATNASYSFTANITNHHGNFSVVATDNISSATSTNAYCFVMLRPGIVPGTGLFSQNVLQGSTLTLSITVTGAPPLGFRWLRGGSFYTNTTVPVLVISNYQTNAANSPTWRVGVTNVAHTTAVSSPNVGSVTIGILPDFDGDGISDWWETNYFGNVGTTNSNANALLDPDGDGMNNLDEFRSGTIPTNALSVLKVLFTETNAGVLRFIAQTNLSYSVQWRTNLLSPTWTNLTSITASPLVRTIAVDSALAPPGAERYFRVVTPLVP